MHGLLYIYICLVVSPNSGFVSFCTAQAPDIWMLVNLANLKRVTSRLLYACTEIGSLHPRQSQANAFCQRLLTFFHLFLCFCNNSGAQGHLTPLRLPPAMPHTNAMILHQVMVILINKLHSRDQEPNIVGLGRLRLVSKAVCSVALTAVQRCEVYLGGAGTSPDLQQLVAITGQTSPDPQQLARLMANAQLKDVKVTLIVKSGEIFGTSC